MPKVKNAQLRYRIIDRCIRNEYKPYPSKEELRQACEEGLYGSELGDRISESTIEKDIFSMREEMDAPIKYSKKDNGYYYDGDFTMDDIPLEKDDIEAIKFAANTLFQFKSIPVFQRFDEAITKILDSVQEGEILEGEEQKKIQFNNTPGARGTELLTPILKAINERKQVQFNYHKKFDAEADFRRVHPYILREHKNRWYLIGYSTRKEALRTFGLDRITDFEPIDEHFDPDPSFDPEQFFKYAVGITALSGYPEFVRLRFEKSIAPYVKSQPLHHSQVIEEENDEYMQVKIEAWNTWELRTMIMGYGSKVEVLEPKAIRDKIKEEAEKLIKFYS